MIRPRAPWLWLGVGSVAQFNETMPHSALHGRTPDEVYFGKGEDIPVSLAAARQAARARRLTENRAVTCETCLPTVAPTSTLKDAA